MARGGSEAPEGTQAPGGGQSVPHIIVDDEDSAPREDSAPVGPQEGEKASGAEPEEPPQPVVPESLAEPSPSSGAGTGALVGASQAETTMVPPTPSAGEAGVRPTAPSAAGDPQGAPSSHKKSAPRASRKQKAPSVALAPLKAVKRGAQLTPESARPVSPPPPGYEEGGRHQGQDTGAPKPQGPEETALASGAVPPPEDADLGGAGLDACVRAGVEALNRASQLVARDMYNLAQALKATSLEKSVFLHRERDAWASFENERAAREAAEGELVKEFCEGYVLPDDETEAQEEVQRLEDAATVPGDALAAFFDDEVELPPLRAQGPGQTGQ
ncbi:basic salivary proline-rich protein 1-like [Sorghum bicolor]|uniref:basic salivary proline-rich protein 1-like n=1 Tax=Sorghum bicolor TaxID=4558 RepID=UPI000B4257B9|nr:basic salivary proline-rich protein 1-like [Sorghum bicolor]|eukprot:XP_021306703.1 basic salivary proline-rich protein 1-like [Sorghum bicolor]